MDKMEMVEGQYYTVTFKSQSGNYRWYKKVFTGQFIHYAKDEVEHRAFFSLRPIAGTSDLRIENILSVEPVEKTTKSPVNKPMVSLPKSLGLYEEKRGNRNA